MSKAYLRHLPKVPSYVLPRDATCSICTQPYENQTTDSGSFENAVRLPCKHVFGSECLLEWLRHGNTCPLCRGELLFPDEDGRELEGGDGDKLFLMLNIQNIEDWEEYWYITFWILHVHGDKAVEQKWQQWHQDWIEAAEQWDESSEALARAAISTSLVMPRQILNNVLQVKTTAGAIQTLRFREYRLYMQLQPNGADRPELKAPPGFQITPTQEDALFQELERREAFECMARFHPLSKREQWNKLRDVGFVWDPEWAPLWRSRPGRWSRHSSY